MLVLCTGNSARSILAEALINRLGAGRLRAHSAGSHPAGRVNRFALALLNGRGFDTAGLASKSWDVFAAPGAPPIDAVITVCDNAANEVCPIWPGRPVTAHWGIPDPAAATGDDAAKRAAFEAAYEALAARVAALIALPVETLDARALQARLAAIPDAL